MLAPEPAANRRYIYRGGRLRELQRSPLAFARSGLLGPLGLARLAMEPLVRSRHDGDAEGSTGEDESLYEFAARRMGRQAARRLISPVVLGIFAGDARKLSAAAAFSAPGRDGAGPTVPCSRRCAPAASAGFRRRDTGLSAAASRFFRGPSQACRESKSAATGGSPRLNGVAAASGSLRPAAKSLETQSSSRPTCLRPRTWSPASRPRPPTNSGRSSRHRWRSSTPPSTPRPLPTSNRPTASSSPAAEGIRMLGCQYETATFRGRGPNGTFLARSMFGGSVDPEAADLGDAQLVDLTLRELRRTAGLDADPTHTSVARWPHAIPQYAPGHPRRVARVEAALDPIDGFYLAGNALHGVGLSRAIAVGAEWRGKGRPPAAPVAASSGLHSPAQGTNTRGESPMKEALQFYINGEWVDPVTPKAMDVIDPSTEEAIGRISLGSAADVDKAVAAAQAAFESFSQTSQEERVELLGRIVAGYQARIGEMAETISMEMGRSGLARQGGPGALRPRPLRRRPERAEGLRLRRDPRHDEHRQGTGRRLRPNHALELADQPDRLQGRAGARRGLHDGPEAERGGAAQRDPARRDSPRRGRSAGRLQPDQRRGPRGRRCAVRPPRHRHDVLHRFHARRPSRRQGRRRLDQAGRPGTRRQVAQHRPRGRRHRQGGKGGHPAVLPEQRPVLQRPDADARARRRRTPVRSRSPRLRPKRPPSARRNRKASPSARSSARSSTTRSRP